MIRTEAARIMVVDDEPGVLETIAAILTREGYEVTAALDLSTALHHLATGTYNVVVADLRLDGDSGLVLLHEIKRRWPRTVSLVLTGYASLQSAVEALREGAYDYLIKPCDVEELKLTVARAVERSLLARELEDRLLELDAANARLARFNEELYRRVQEATTELSQKIHELAEAKRRLEEEQRQREEFVSLIVHELHQPLTIISGYAQLLGRATLSPEKSEHARASIYAETRRVTRLVQDLADVARLDSGQFRIHPVGCNLAELVREQVELSRIYSDRHTIEVDLPPEPVLARCDRDRVAQVVSNLLTNAIKYTSEGMVRVALAVEGDHATLTVQDEGPGIPPDRLEEIFQRYVRLESTANGERPKGSGLGLYVARAIVEAHGGQIWAESPGPGRGATFKVVLPLTQPKPCPDPSGGPAATIGAGADGEE